MTYEEALKHIKPRLKLYIQCTDDNIALHKAIEALEKQISTPDIEEVRQGMWIKDETKKRDDGEIYDYCCSLCKSPAAEGSYGNHDVLTPYCSHCGAKMELKNGVRKVDCSMTEDEYNKGLNDLFEGMIKAAKSSVEKITCQYCKHCYKQEGVDWDMNPCWKYNCWRTGRAIPTDPHFSCRYAEKRVEE